MEAINLSMMFEDAVDPVHTVIYAPTVYKLADVTPTPVDVHAQRVEARLRLMQSYYRSRYGRDFDFSPLSKEG